MTQQSIPYPIEVLADLEYCLACEKTLSIDHANNNKQCQRCNIRYVLDEDSFTAAVSSPERTPSRVVKDSNTSPDAERRNDVPASTYNSGPAHNHVTTTQTSAPRVDYGDRENLFRSVRELVSQVSAATRYGTCTSINVAVTEIVGYTPTTAVQLQDPLCMRCPNSSVDNVNLLGIEGGVWEVQCTQCSDRWLVPAALIPGDWGMIDCQGCGKKDIPFAQFQATDGTHFVTCKHCGKNYMLQDKGTGRTRMVSESPYAQRRRAESLKSYTRTDYEMHALIQQYSVTEQAKAFAQYEGGGKVRGKAPYLVNDMVSTYYDFQSSSHHQHYPKAQGYPQQHYPEPPPYATKAPPPNPVDAARPFVNAVGGLIQKGVGPKRAGFVEDAIGVVDGGLAIGAAVDRRKKGQIGKATLGQHMGAGVAGVLGNVGQFALNFVPFGRAIGGAIVPAVANFIGKPIGKFIAKLMK